MGDITRVCKRCKGLFAVLHGNEEYHRKCSALMQEKRSEAQSMAKRYLTDPYWKNESILKRLLKKDCGQFVYFSAYLNLIGFDFTLFRGIQTRGRIEIYIATKHGFSYLPDGYIKIWKL